MIEKQSHYIVKCEDGKIRVSMFRDGDKKNHELKIGDTLSWVDTSVWTWPKYSGEIISTCHNDWDYGLPIYQRCLNLSESEDFRDLVMKLHKIH